MRAASFVLVTALLASACSQAQEGAADRQPKPAANDSQKSYSPRSGLWEQTITSATAGAPVTFRVCSADDESDGNPFAPPSEEAGDCGKPTFNRTPTGVTFESTCVSEDMTMTSKGTVTGDLGSRYEAMINIRMSGPALPPGAPAESNVRVSARRIGDCPAGVEPGIILP